MKKTDLTPAGKLLKVILALWLPPGFTMNDEGMLSKWQRLIQALFYFF